MKSEGDRSSHGQASLPLEILLYGLVMLLAIWLRLAQLDFFPLSDLEAQNALAAGSSEPARSTSAAHTAITVFAFTLMGESEAGARWGPAVAGVALVLTPALLRRKIGQGPAFISALLFAISPVLWTTSRTADGAMIAAFGIAAAVFLLATERPELSAASLGLALASGSSAIMGLVGIGIGAVVFEIIRRRRSKVVAYPFAAPEYWGRYLLILVIVMLAVGTGIGFFTGLLQGVFQGLGSWISGLFESSGVAFVAMIVMLIAYEPLALAFGVFAVIDRIRRQDPMEVFLCCWTIGSLIVLWLYRGRMPTDLVWTVIPMTVLAAKVVRNLLNEIARTENAWLVLGFTAAIVALAAFAYLQLRAGVLASDSGPSLFGLPTQLVAAWMGVSLAVLALILLAVGWSKDVAIPIAGASFVLVFLGLSISSGVALNFGEPTAKEFFRPQASTKGLTTLGESLAVLSRATTGRRDALPIEVSDPPTPALAWVIREYPESEETENPAVVLAREGGPLPGDYLGQSVTIGESLGWTGGLPPDLLRWFVLRDMPTAVDRWVLLVRKDVAGVEEVLPLETES